MRLIGAASIVFITTLVLATSTTGPAVTAVEPAQSSAGDSAKRHRDNDRPEHRFGRKIFREDTFGDEQLWTDVLRMHEVIAGVDPATALGLGLKVDADALPAEVSRRSSAERSLDDPAVTARCCDSTRSSASADGSTSSASWCVSASPAPSATRRSTTRSRRASASGSTAGRTPTSTWARSSPFHPSSTKPRKAEFIAVGSRQVRSTPSCLRRHEPHPPQHAVDPDRHPGDLRTAARRLRDLHRRRTDLVLEQLCGSESDGRARLVHRRTDRSLHRADARPGDSEAARAALLSVEPARAAAARGQLRPRRGEARPAVVPRSGPLCNLPPRAELHRRLDGPGAASPSSTMPRKSAPIPRTPNESAPANTGRRPCARCGSTRRTSTTGARRISSPWSSTTTGSSTWSSRRRRRRI